MPDVLNPSLYQRLKRHFGVVRVVNPGQSFLARPIRDGITDEPKLDIKQSGEYYLANCPFCNDHRFRLYVHHMYGKRDDFGRKMTYMAICYNETACMTKEHNQAELKSIVEEMDGVLETARVRKGVEVPFEARKVDWPGPCRSLTKLKSRHSARQYLESRNFDIEYLTKHFDVRYCLDSHYFLARERLIIPVYDHGKLVGWQARYNGELDWKNKSLNLPPKYFTLPGMPRRLLIYNFDKARDYSTGIIMEGPTDVWAMGLMGVCTFGATMTSLQLRKFLAIFRRRTAVLLYDPEEFEERAVKRLRETLTSKMPGRFAAIKLPEGTDPGALDRSFLRDYVFQEAKKLGVKVSYKKWTKVTK
jgi:hypothetical protein